MDYKYLLDLAIILLCTKALGLLTRRVQMPQVVGALLAGLLLGPAGVGILTETSFLQSVAEIGVIVLMFCAGMETKQVVEYAHAHGVVVEAELGTLAGIEDEVVVESGHESYTRPEEVEEFVDRTGCDSLAIAIGTSHGAYKFTPDQCTRNADGILVPPPLRFDVLEECMKRLPEFPIVLHGSSSVPQEFVKMVNHLPDIP